ncbi:MAG TPA: S41 family peptidase [Gemmatimonadaceae bacterium]
MTHLGIRLNRAALLGALVATAAPAISARGQSRSTFDRALELASFDTAWTRVRDNYYDAGLRGLNWQALRDSLRPLVERGDSRDDTRAAISTLLSRLGESHFGVLPGDAMDAGAAAANDRAGDAGLEVRFLDSALVVTRIEPGAPGLALGIRPGWVIEEIDTVRVRDVLRATLQVPEPNRRFALVRLTLNLNGRLTGPAGGTLRIVARDGADRRRELALPLRETPGQVITYGALPPLHVQFESKRLTSHAGCVGVIRFNIFMTPVMPQFQDAMGTMGDCRGVVLDLRGNVGGVGAMIMGMSGHFFTEPETLGTMRLREATMRYVANPIRVSRDGQPMRPFAGRVAILVDELSASTTEILAAALQRLGRARVFGGPSAGQALPAVVTTLPNGDRLMYVIGDFAGPGGARLEGTGVSPDVATPLSRRALLQGRDDALDAALLWINGANTAHPYQSR